MMRSAEAIGMRHILLGAAIFALAFSLALRAQGRDAQTAADVPIEAQKTVLAVQQALGMIRGMNHIDALNDVVLIGTDTMGVFGQAFRSDMPWPVCTLTHYQASITHSDWGLRAEIERTNPVGIIQGRGGLPLAAPQKLIQVVAGTLVWNELDPGIDATPAQGTYADRFLPQSSTPKRSI
jgi:hypothetical protein